MREFDPKSQMVNIGKRGGPPRWYLQSRHRVIWARNHRSFDDVNVDFGIEIQILEHDKEAGTCVVECTIRHKEGYILAQDIKQESRDALPKHMKGYYLEKAVTGAKGRALASLGFGTEAAFELESEAELEQPVDGPVTPEGNTSPVEDFKKEEKSGGEASDKVKMVTKTQLEAMKPIMDAKGIDGNEFRRLWGDPAKLTFESAGKIIEELRAMPEKSPPPATTEEDDIPF